MAMVHGHKIRCAKIKPVVTTFGQTMLYCLLVLVFYSIKNNMFL